MSDPSAHNDGQLQIDEKRRRLIGMAGSGVLLAGLGGATLAATEETRAAATSLRWGIVGTGGIANRMAPMIGLADGAQLVSVSSRRMATAQEFADKHKLEHAFDDWSRMFEFDGVDAIYIATPTSVKEEIVIAAATQGKHVLCEKPLPDLASTRRMVAACRANNVGFMDGTHFPHNPRTAQLQALLNEELGVRQYAASVFQFGLTDADNIRLNPQLEPYGAIGDAGWYNMRAAVEFLAPDIAIRSVEAKARRGGKHDAVIAASGVIEFDDRSTTTFHCGMDSGNFAMDLTLSCSQGMVLLDDFVGQFRRDGKCSYTLRQGREPRTVDIALAKPQAALMFQDFSAMSGDPASFEAGIRASERTQQWLDAVWASAIANEV